MQRYDIWDDTRNESHNGEWVLHSDALSEIAAAVARATEEAEQRGADRAEARIVAWFNDPSTVDESPAYYAEAIRRGDHHAHGHKEVEE